MEVSQMNDTKALENGREVRHRNTVSIRHDDIPLNEYGVTGCKAKHPRKLDEPPSGDLLHLRLERHRHHFLKA